MFLSEILTKDYLQEEYVNKGRFAKDIAIENGCSAGTVCRYLRKAGITVENRYESRKYRGYKNPAREILTESYLRREYVDKHRSMNSIANELNCSNTLIREYLDKYGIDVDKSHQCGKFFGEDNYLTNSYLCESHGYILVRLPNHRLADSRGYVRLHILLAEYYYNRKLKPGEVVHHKNRNRQDNRKENLVIMTKKEHDALHLPDAIKKSHESRRRSKSFKGIKLVTPSTKKICRPTLKIKV